MKVELKKWKQKELIYKIKTKKNIAWDGLAKSLKVSPGALKGWAMEKNLMPLHVLNKLDQENYYQKYILAIKTDNWGTVKGGLNSSGTLKSINIPHKNVDLAELVGIILGDGNIHCFKKGKKVATYMLRIAGHKTDDYEYLTKHVWNIIQKQFSIAPKIDERKSKEMLIIVHSRQLVEYLIRIGLKPGDKIESQVGIPEWIKRNNTYLKACLRGLIDTDGCIYTLKPHYPNLFQLSFKNYNKKLMKDTREAFLRLGYPISKISMGKQLYLTQQKFIRKFYKEIGFSNAKHIKRYNNHSPVV